jgi:hypothetical protein
METRPSELTVPNASDNATEKSNQQYLLKTIDNAYDAFKASKQPDSMTLWAMVRPVINWAKEQLLQQAPADKQNETKQILKAIKQLQKGLSEVKAQTTTPPGPRAQAHGTYAQVAGRGSLAADAPIIRKETAPVDTAKLRQVTVRISNKEEKKQAAVKHPRLLVKDFQNQANTATADIIAAHRTRSGDVVLNTVSVESRKKLEQEEEWARMVYPSAQVLKQTFPVIVHGVNKSTIDVANAIGTIQRLNKENASLHPGNKIVALSWPKMASRLTAEGKEKTVSSLLIEYRTTEEVNQVVRKGLVSECTLHPA